MPESLSSSQRTTSIVALNAVSVLSQIGQYGIGTTLLPIALEVRGASPQLIGITSSALWVGMLAGLLVAGQLTRWLGYRMTVLAGLAISSISFAAIPILNWNWWSFPAAAIGFGLGLRWIANETWLYRLAPANARGRIVGIHETLIGVAAVAGPLIIVALGAIKPTAFWLSAAVVSMAAIPLFLAVTLPAVDKAANEQHSRVSKSNFSLSKSKLGIHQKLIYWMGFGALIAGLGGVVEGSLLALLPVYSTHAGFTSTDSAWLFTILGVGAMVCQFPIGWLADHKGVLWTSKLCALFAALSVLLALGYDTTLQALAFSMFILGGATAGLLTLGLVWATQHSVGAELTSRVRQVSIIYTLFSAAGPVLAGFIVSHIGISSLFWQQLAVTLVLAVVLLKHSPDD